MLNLAHRVIDVVIQLECKHGQRRISRIWHAGAPLAVQE
jgi:hypothetical protein